MVVIANCILIVTLPLCLINGSVISFRMAMCTEKFSYNILWLKVTIWYSSNHWDETRVLLNGPSRKTDLLLFLSLFLCLECGQDVSVISWSRGKGTQAKEGSAGEQKNLDNDSAVYSLPLCFSFYKKKIYQFWLGPCGIQINTILWIENDIISPNPPSKLLQQALSYTHSPDEETKAQRG